MNEISELRKREIAEQFTKLVADGGSVFEATDLLALKYGLSRPEVLAIVKEIKGEFIMITTLLYLVIYIIVIGLVFWLLNYLVDTVPMQPQFKSIAKIILTVLAVVIIILLLLSLIGGADVGFPRLVR